MVQSDLKGVTLSLQDFVSWDGEVVDRKWTQKKSEKYIQNVYDLREDIVDDEKDPNISDFGKASWYFAP